MLIFYVKIYFIMYPYNEKVIFYINSNFIWKIYNDLFSKMLYFIEIYYFSLFTRITYNGPQIIYRLFGNVFIFIFYLFFLSLCN